MVYKTKTGMSQKRDIREKSGEPKRYRFVTKRKEGKLYGKYNELFSV